MEIRKRGNNHQELLSLCNILKAMFFKFCMFHQAKG